MSFRSSGKQFHVVDLAQADARPEMGPGWCRGSLVYVTVSLQLLYEHRICEAAQVVSVVNMTTRTNYCWQCCSLSVSVNITIRPRASEAANRCLGCEWSADAAAAGDGVSVGWELRWCQMPVLETSSEMLTSSCAWVTDGLTSAVWWFMLVASMPIVITCCVHTYHPHTTWLCVCA